MSGRSDVWTLGRPDVRTSGRPDARAFGRLLLSFSIFYEDTEPKYFFGVVPYFFLNALIK